MSGIDELSNKLKKFRDKVNGKISDKSLKLKEDGKYSVIFVILHSSEKDFKLPFFSKLTFNECKKTWKS